METKYKQQICIGMISYLPDNEHREERIRRCKNLIAQCDELLDIPIVVIAQNWKSEITSKNLIRLDYQRLGITKARKILWEYFRQSAYDWLICFDDDCILEGNKADGNRFLEFLSEKTDGYLCGVKYEFKLSAFHKKTAFRLDIPDLDVELKTGFEDYGFFRILERKFQDLEMKYDWGSLKETSNWFGDSTSSWHRTEIAALTKQTNEFVQKELNKT